MILNFLAVIHGVYVPFTSAIEEAVEENELATLTKNDYKQVQAHLLANTSKLSDDCEQCALNVAFNCDS